MGLTKHAKYGLLLILFANNAFAGETDNVKTNLALININNIKTERAGQLVIFVFSRDGFPKEHNKALSKFIYPVTSAQQKIEIAVPLKKFFAIKVLHDENMDEKVTKNWTGIIPRDGIGFSNGARIVFSPPKFDDAKILYTEQPSPVINIQYF